MKTKILLFVMIFSAILFFDYVLLIVIGCTSCAVGVKDSFYCNVFCNLAKVLIVATTLLPFVIAAYKSIKGHSQ